MGDRWSIAWRVHDAQFWGVPQRRRRIALVADFGGQSAPEILFERKSVCGDIAESGTAGQGIAVDAERSANETISFLERAGCQGEVKEYLYSENGQEHCQHSTINQCCNISGNDISGTLDASYYKGVGERLSTEREVVAVYPQLARTLSARADSSPCIDRGQNIVYCLQGNGIDRADTAGCNGKGWRENECYTLNTIDRPAVCAAFKSTMGAKARGIGYEIEKAPTQGTDSSTAVYIEPILLESNQNHATIRTDGISTTLPASAGAGGGYVPMVYDARGNGNGELAPTITGDHQNRVTDYTALCIGNGQMCNMSMKPIANSLDTMHDQQAVITAVDFFSAKESDINGTLLARCSNNLNSNNVCRVENIVRRLTPLEAERLQGYPDRWTDIGDWTDSKGKKHKDADSPRYKALGNSIALPFWQWLADRICAQYDRETTMASLFDGIGGFPLVFTRTGKCKPVWVSEIEEFPIAVTKIRFKE